MKQKYIVYSHYTVAIDKIVKAYSPAEAKYIIEQQMKKRGDIEPVVDKIISLEEEQRINDCRGGRAL